MSLSKLLENDFEVFFLLLLKFFLADLEVCFLEVFNCILDGLLRVNRVSRLYKPGDMDGISSRYFAFLIS